MSGVLALVGPTGIGKTETALALAEQLPAEIVAVDSMQVYRQMDIGTGKPPADVRERVPHHGIDLADPEEEFDALRYAETVAPVIEQIRARGKWAVLVGGCGLYLRVLLKGICEAPGKDPEVRAKLLERAAGSGAPALHARLMEVDAPAARRIHPNDVRRVVRALEVYEVTGRPMTEWHKDVPVSPLSAECRIIGLDCEREQLYSRIESRIDGWLAGGWVEETRALSRRRLSLTAREALGYRELLDHFEGKTGWEEAKELIHRNTRRYAKRQLSWFRHEPDVRWLSGFEPRSAAREILSLSQAA